MKFIQLKTIRYKSKLNPPLKNSQNIYYERSGYIIKLYLDDYCGCGESAPLPHFSKENIKQVEWAIEELKSVLNVNENYSKNELFNLFKIFSENSPSLNFALDVALYDILSQKQNITLSKYLNPNSKTKIKLGSTNKFSNPITNIKIKFGLKNIDEEMKNLEQLSRANPNIVFRLDCNRMFDCDNMISLCKKIRPYNIEYIEEPLKNPTIENLKKLNYKTDIPIALDETIIMGNYKDLINNKLIKYAVLKASLLGSMDYIISLIDYFKKNNIKIIISSSLQLQVGNLSNIHIAAILNNNLYHGLNNYEYFENVQFPYSKNATHVDISHMVGLGESWDD